ncbi:ABC transporter substrate-binding protein [Sciscionella sediminilitoris]|uniref:ABC transporter substrate-binding protein n=1 Tax=Sciscionella sediminilitoris TaxID=1445613 RepID=UPI0004DF40CA|nr:ABC transporter substrate-binding protein [Sciscionella sp. SE31]
MRKPGKLGAIAGLLSLGVALTACGTSGNAGESKGGNGLNPPKLEAMKQLGAGEGQVNVLAWPGYAENGSNDPKINWVGPFEKETGCQVNVKTFGTSDEAVNLLKSGQYDVVSASGDASLRLIASGDVEPINTKLVPNYADIQPFLKNRAWNSVKGTSYGIPHGWGANMLTYRTDKVKPAPDSWDVMFGENSPYKGKIEGYDSPIHIADAALYLKAHKPELGIKNPYALDDKQFNAAVDLLKKQRPNVVEYWSDYLKEVQSFSSGNAHVGTAWQVMVNTAKKNGAPIADVLPKEGATGWSDTWMLSSKSKHKNCSYKWMNYITGPQVQAQVADYFGEAPANAKACDVAEDKTVCDTYHAKDADFANKIQYWTTPIEQCLDGRTDVKCKDYSDWTKAWTEIKG